MRGLRLLTCFATRGLAPVAFAAAMGVGCTTQSAQSTTPTREPTFTPRTLPTPVPSIALPTPAPTPPPVAAAPTATPAPVLPLRIAAQLDPPAPRAGSEFVLQLTITNDGDRSAHGVYIATSGPWDRWTIIDISPPSDFARDAAGWRIISNLDIPPHDSRAIALQLRADSPSEDQLTFAVREAEPGELR